MREVDILIVPHKDISSYSLATAEAMAYGMPIIASDAGGLSCQIDNGVTGVLFKLDSKSELADAIKICWRTMRNERNWAKMQGNMPKRSSHGEMFAIGL